MGSTCLYWSQPIVPRSPSSSQTRASAVSSPSLKRRRNNGSALACRYVRRFDRSSLFGAKLTKLRSSQSFEYSQSQPQLTALRTYSASLDAFHFQDDRDENGDSDDNGKGVEPAWQGYEPPAIIERKANSVDLPLSLRMIKRKLKWQDGIIGGESAYCSVKKAFSSMVFIIRELHSFTLQMREILFYEDLQGIIVRVRREMHASFVWLFQHVFSHTPILMVYVMILLANFTVYSMASNTALAVSVSRPEVSSVIQVEDKKNLNFDSSSIKRFSVSSSSGKTRSIGENNNGGGGKIRPVASGTDGDGGFDRIDPFRTIVPDSASQSSSLGTSTQAESGPEQLVKVEELNLWNSILDEAFQLQASARHESLDHETMQRFVSPVKADIESDDYADYFKTQLVYQTRLRREPNDPLLLANYAQFLYLIAHDYDRAEEYFKRAIGVEPADAEAFNKYASFLWRVRKDLCAAEDSFLEAIAADPTNSYYAANYAHFLWNTGAEDTCFPLDSPGAPQEEA